MTGLYIGIMSGTSVDAIDAVLADFDDTPGDTGSGRHAHDGGPPGRVRLLASVSHAWPDALRRELLALGTGGERELDRAGEADRQVAAHFAAAVTALLGQAGLRPQDIRAIGSHGQTVRHRPNAAHPFTLQLGDPNTLAERTGIAVVADFRRRDMAAGGQGAPLVPAFHQAMFARPDTCVAVLNLGGIANITLLPPDGDASGHDTGPANMLLDGWCQRHTGQPFDRDGAWAASATADADLLARLLAHPYLARTPPKSTGREEFGMDWLDAQLRDLDLTPATVQATLLALTARSVADALSRHADSGHLLLCGGGAHNGALVAALAGLLPGWRLGSTSEQGLDPSWVEATAFAWLARQTVLGLPGNLPAVTGAAGRRVLGGYYPAGTGVRLP